MLAIRNKQKIDKKAYHWVKNGENNKYLLKRSVKSKKKKSFQKKYLSQKGIRPKKKKYFCQKNGVFYQKTRKNDPI